MRTRRRFIPLLLFTSLFLAACTPDPNHEFIQGQWIFANAQGDSLSGSGHVFYEWRFDNGSFSNYFEVALGKPQTLSGYYRILSSEGDQIVLELYDLDGTEAAQYSDRRGEVTLTIDREGELLKIARQWFYRGYTPSD